MSKAVHVVDGEASESESEIELGKSPDQEVFNSEAFIIPGEAPESDDESKLPAKSTQEAVSIPATPPAAHPMRQQYTSLLHQKLWECNVSLRATTEGLLRHSADIAADKLSRADKTLLTVQESMRASNASLTLARARLKQIQSSLERANCTTALPTVRIK